MYRSAKNTPWLRAVETSTDKVVQSRTLSDSELIEGVMQGNTEVSGAFHDRLVDVIDHTLFRVLGRRDSDHEDLIQVCFEQVLRTLVSRSFAGECSLRTWTGRITTHVALNTLRSRVRERRVFFRSDDADYEPPSPGDSTSRTHAILDLDRARRVLANMRRSKSEVLILHDVHGYNLNEIAALMDVSVAAAQSRLVRGRTEFRAKLAALEARSPRKLSTATEEASVNDPVNAEHGLPLAAKIDAASPPISGGQNV